MSLMELELPIDIEGNKRSFKVRRDSTGVETIEEPGTYLGHLTCIPYFHSLIDRDGMVHFFRIDREFRKFFPYLSIPDLPDVFREEDDVSDGVGAVGLCEKTDGSIRVILCTDKVFEKMVKEIPLRQEDEK